MDPNTYTEEQLALDTGVKRSFLSRLRGDSLIFGSDWVNTRSGVVYTEAGLEKTRAALKALGAEVPKNGAPGPGAGAPSQNGHPAPLFTLLVLGDTFNGRCCRAQIEGRSEPHRAFVKPTHRLGAFTLSAGLRLTGCTRINDEMYEYHGPVPFRRGQPLPTQNPSGNPSGNPAPQLPNNREGGESA